MSLDTVQTDMRVMKSELDEVWDELRALRRPASVATIGGFRPSEDPLKSWIIRGVSLPKESLPLWHGVEMFPLLQVRIDELPVVPQPLHHVAMLVVYMNRSTIPFNKPHGDGWLIREYATLDGLVPLPAVDMPYRPFPISWRKVEDDMPGWEDASELMDMTAISRDEAAADRFFQDFGPYNGMKFGGYPRDLQHSAGLDSFVFQIDSDAKSGWNWAGDGVAYFHCADGQEWRFSCQMT
jgi:hypothetical protein